MRERVGGNVKERHIAFRAVFFNVVLVSREPAILL